MTDRRGTRPPAGYVSPSGDVMVPPEMARILTYHGKLDDFAIRVRGRRADLDALLEALRVVGARWAGSDRGTERAEAPEADPQWYTTSQVGRRIGVSSRRVLQLIASGELQAETFGGAWRISREDLRHLQAARQRK